MNINLGGSILLIAIGVILTFVAAGIVQLIGIVLIILGAVGLVLNVFSGRRNSQI